MTARFELNKRTSLRESIGETEVLGRIRLLLRTPQGKGRTVVLVEGIDDTRLYAKFFDPNRSFVEGCAGVGNLVKIIEQLNQESISVVGIRDADYIRLQHPTKQRPSNLFLTDGHDAEMMILKEREVLYNLLIEYRMNASPDRLINEILDAASLWGYVRWYNVERRSTIAMTELHAYASPSHLKARIHSDYPELSRFIAQHPDCDLFELCQGHDTVQLLAARLSKNAQRSVSSRELAALLRISYSMHYFKNSSLYRELRLYFQQNNDLKLLRE